ncbi:DUF3291 domain-containing protein [Pontimicrobium sp. SW4]|uniref:DUF3291 domain-containing protein n=1 Tax=Pontimicrobium sp. SW4 TaxID=3153519 RepID=A0AAU7BXB0_9FLAO
MKYYLAQVNIAKMLAPIDDPIMADFVNNLDRINAVADKSEGFIWRLQGIESNATAIKAFDDDTLIINMSVWEDMEALFNYTYKSDHVAIFARRKEWFSRIKDMHMVFWFIPEGHTPSPKEARERLEYANTHGTSPYAFTFKDKFTVNDFLNYNCLE